MSDVHELISEALKANIPMEDIVADLESSDNEEERAWAKRWKTTSESPEYQAGYSDTNVDAKGSPSTGLLERIDQLTPGEVAAAVGGAAALFKAPNIYQNIQENKIANRKLDIEARKADLYAQQVGKQGMAPAIAEPNVVPELPEVPKLSALEEARINTERARAEAIQAKIALEERKIALAEQKAKAAEEAKSAAAASQKTTASGAVNPEDRQMLNSSEKAKMDKAIMADQKAAEGASRAAQAAQSMQPIEPPAAAAPAAPAPAPAPAPAGVAPEQPAGGIAPPKSSEITLTPSPEVTAEMKVVPKEAVPAEAPRPAGSVPPKAKEKKTFAKIEELPKDMQFKAGFGGGDSWLHDTVGPDVRKFIIDEFNGGKPIGGGQAGMDKAYGLVGKYEEWLKSNIPEQTLNRAERKAAGVPPPKQYGALGKAVKVGGAAGLLMTAAQAANAKEAARNVGEALLPIGATPLELQPGTLTEKQLNAFKEAEKLGSPYRSVKPKKK